MTLDEKNKNAIANHRLQKAKNTFAEARGIFGMGFWNAAVNRLYYACYYAATALLVKHGYSTHTHSGVATLLNKHFVHEGILGKEQGKLFGRILEFRQRSDYDDSMIMEENDIAPFVKPVQSFIQEIENILSNGEHQQ
jgi:uncharacterized protein (UPF0332 family)